jgi:GNAT superfamily N-acetyltransferase
MARDVRRVELDTILALKQRVLRPHQTIEELAQENAGLPDLACFAVVEGERVIGTATVHREAAPWAPHETRAWRLRSMATEEGRRGEGIGTAALAAAVEHVRSQGARLFWCNARTPAIAFYERAGFRTRGDPWDEPHIGPHIAMFLVLS